MKWIKLHEGSYKYVSDDDSRPAVTLPKKQMGIPKILFTPSWKKYEGDMWNTDTKHSVNAADKFYLEREHEMKVNDKARRWEEGRKRSWAKDKPTWVKKQEGVT